VHPVHRLDRPTSGVLVFALDREAAGLLGRAFEEGRVEKTYLAVVRGHPPEQLVVDHPLADPEGGAAGGRPREARTVLRRLGTAELPWPVDCWPTSRYALLELRLETGRRHQIRRHLHHVSHPVIGDSTWGKAVHNRLFRQHFGVGRLLLACVALGFPHPADGRPMRVTAPLEREFGRVVEALGWSGVLPA
jgi:tRNA pseudouridine65 synthase